MSDKMSMKMGLAKFFSIFFILSTTLLRAADQVAQAPQTPEELRQAAEEAAQKLTGGLIQIADDKRIENQLKDSAKFAVCQKAFQAKVKSTPSSLVKLGDVPECANVIPNKKEELEELVKNLNPSSEALRFQKDANYKAVYDYMNERLETALYGEENNPNDKKLHLVDHKNFYTLYKSQITKKFLLDTSSYCMEVFGPKYARDASTTRAVDDPNFDYKSWMENEIKAGNTKLIGKEFNVCLISIPCNCFGEDLGQAKYCPETDTKTNKPTRIVFVTDTKVKQQACLLTSRLKELKQEMIALKKIDEGYASIGDGAALSSSNIIKYDPTEKNKTADDLTMIATDDYSKATTDLDTKSKEFKKKCDNGNIKLTDAECSDISTIDSNKFADIQLEYQLKTKAMAENIDRMDDEKLKVYLKDQKKTDEEIQQLYKDHAGDFAKIKSQIKNQLLTEREQIVKEIADQINQNSVITDHDNNKNALNSNSNVKKVAENQVERTKRLIQYNNIVSAYLATTSESGKSGHYTKGLEREIASESGATKKDEDYFKQLKTAQKDLSKDSGDASSGATLLDVSAIDTILGNAK